MLAPSRRWLLALALLALVGLTGCGPRWIVLSQASPNPLLHQRSFAVLPIDFGELQVGYKAEVDYLAEKSEAQRASWANDKAEVNTRFASSLISNAAELGLQVVPATGPMSAPFLVRAHATRIEPGFYVGVATGNGSVALEVTITTPDGRPLDRFLIDMPAGGFSVTLRLSASAQAAGSQVAKYLHRRSAPDVD